MHLVEMNVPIVMCNRNKGIVMPSYESADAAGMDLQADIEEPFELGPGERRLVDTGIKIAVPQYFEMQVRPRSGLAHKHGLSVVNSPGTIDADYRGEIKVNLVNMGLFPVTITPLMRIAQMVLSPVTRARLIETDALSETVRGESGFGSTGTHYATSK
jgi:dUTP pyrophosphatase